MTSESRGAIDRVCNVLNCFCSGNGNVFVTTTSLTSASAKRSLAGPESMGCVAER